jgi:hypothetical protein
MPSDRHIIEIVESSRGLYGPATSPRAGAQASFDAQGANVKGLEKSFEEALTKASAKINRPGGGAAIPPYTPKAPPITPPPPPPGSPPGVPPIAPGAGGATPGDMGAGPGIVAGALAGANYALIGLGAAAAGASLAVGLMSSNITNLSRDLEGYSGTVAAAVAGAEVQAIQDRLRAGRTAGREVAEVVAERANLASVWMDMKADLAVLTHGLIVQVLRILQVIVTLINDFIDWLKELKQAFINWYAMNFLKLEKHPIISEIMMILRGISKFLRPKKKDVIDPMKEFESFFDPNTIEPLLEEPEFIGTGRRVVPPQKKKANN